MGKKNKKSNERNSVNNRGTPKKSIFITYFFWLIGGFFGLHHLYLDRYRHAFVWFTTFGGFFGIGWLFEVFKIPTYVREINENVKYNSGSKPSISLIRLIGQILTAYMWGSSVYWAIPEKPISGISWSFLMWLIPLGCSLGVWAVGNIGRESGVLWHTLLASYMIYIIRYKLLRSTYWYIEMITISALVFNIFSKKWKERSPKRRSKFKQLCLFLLVIITYLSLYGCYLYFNTDITYQKLQSAYKLFEIARNTSLEELQTVYKQLVMKYNSNKLDKIHSEKTTRDDIKELEEAFNLLKKVKIKEKELREL